MAKKICISGASTTWGAVDLEGGGWVDRLKRDLYASSKGVCQVYNLGISGQTSSEIVERSEIELNSRKPYAVIFVLGVNDAIRLDFKDGNTLVSIAEFSKNLNTLHAIATRFTDKVAFMGPIKVDESKTRPWFVKERDGHDIYWDNTTINEYREKLRKFCSEKNVPLIDLFDIDIELYEDGLHPNANGHKKIFEKVKAELETLGYV